MILRVLKPVKLLAVDPPTIGFTRLQLYRHGAHFVIRRIFGLADHFRRGVFPRRGPAPRLIRHFLAEGDLDDVFTGRNIFASGLRLGFHDDRREGINVLRADGLRG